MGGKKFEKKPPKGKGRITANSKSAGSIAHSKTWSPDQLDAIGRTQLEAIPEDDRKVPATDRRKAVPSMAKKAKRQSYNSPLPSTKLLANIIRSVKSKKKSSSKPATLDTTEQTAMAVNIQDSSQPGTETLDQHPSKSEHDGLRTVARDLEGAESSPNNDVDIIVNAGVRDLKPDLSDDDVAAKTYSDVVRQSLSPDQELIHDQNRESDSIQVTTQDLDLVPPTEDLTIDATQPDNSSTLQDKDPPQDGGSEHGDTMSDTTQQSGQDAMTEEGNPVYDSMVASLQSQINWDGDRAKLIALATYWSKCFALDPIFALYCWQAGGVQCDTELAVVNEEQMYQAGQTFLLWLVNFVFGDRSKITLGDGSYESYDRMRWFLIHLPIAYKTVPEADSFDEDVLDHLCNGIFDEWVVRWENTCGRSDVKDKVVSIDDLTRFLSVSYKEHLSILAQTEDVAMPKEDLNDATRLLQFPNEAPPDYASHLMGRWVLKGKATTLFWFIYKDIDGKQGELAWDKLPQNTPIDPTHWIKRPFGNGTFTIQLVHEAIRYLQERSAGSHATPPRVTKMAPITNLFALSTPKRPMTYAPVPPVAPVPAPAPAAPAPAPGPASAPAPAPMHASTTTPMPVHGQYFPGQYPMGNVAVQGAQLLLGTTAASTPNHYALAMGAIPTDNTWNPMVSQTTHLTAPLGGMIPYTYGTGYTPAPAPAPAPAPGPAPAPAPGPGPPPPPAPGGPPVPPGYPGGPPGSTTVPGMRGMVGVHPMGSHGSGSGGPPGPPGGAPPPPPPSGLGATHGSLPPRSVLPKIKPDASLYRTLSDDCDYNSWSEHFLATTISFGLGPVIDFNYNPDHTTDPAGFAALQQCKAWLWSVLKNKIKTTEGKAIVLTAKSTYDVRSVLYMLQRHSTHTVAAYFNASELMSKLTSASASSFRGTMLQFVNYFITLATQYNELQTDRAQFINPAFIMNMLQNAVKNVPALHKVRQDADYRRATGTGGDLLYHEYIQLLKSAATAHDVSQQGRTARRANAHALISDDGPSDEDVVQELIAFAVRTQGGARMTRAAFDRLSPEGKATWDQLTDADKANILNYAIDRADRASGAGSNTAQPSRRSAPAAPRRVSFAATDDVATDSAPEDTAPDAAATEGDTASAASDGHATTDTPPDDSASLRVNNAVSTNVRQAINNAVSEARRSAHPADPRRVLASRTPTQDRRVNISYRMNNLNLGHLSGGDEVPDEPGQDEDEVPEFSFGSDMWTDAPGYETDSDDADFY